MMNSFLRIRVLAVSFLLAATSAAFVPAGSISTAFSSRQSTVSTTSVAMGVSVLERDSRMASGPASLERTAEQRTKEPTRERKLQGHENWEVRIYNDGLNTREHVARSLVQVTGMSELIAYQTMMQAHQNGIAVVGRWVFEVAEMYHDELKRNGIVCDIIPVEGDGR
jgi:ATP-dependent Clp protease adaptor protein ClpS